MKGINPKMFLVKDLYAKNIQQTPTRNGFGDGLVVAATVNKQLVVLCADLTESTRALPFKQAYPNRFVQIGVSEQSLAAIAAGMALAGKVPFLASYACFSPGRNWEQIRTTVCLNNTNVKIAGAHAGVSVGPDGATHQMLEDIAIMRVLPNMRVVVPCDAMETKKATVAIVADPHPWYIRFAREKSPVFTTSKTPFKLSRIETLRFGSDITIVGAGPLLYEALGAAEQLAKKGIQARVLNCHTVKPLDTREVVRAAKETGALVTVEEAQVAGGLGGAIVECTSQYAPVPVERIGVMDRYGESGDPRELMYAFHLLASDIVKAGQQVYTRKKA